MDADRVLAVTSPAGDCSGYVIGPRLALTSAHGVPRVGDPVTVTALSDGQPRTGTVIWRGSPGGRDDAALIKIDDEQWHPRTGSVRWGRLVTNEPSTPGVGWGFPSWLQVRGKTAEAWQPSGTLNPGSGYAGDRYELSLTAHPPSGGHPWAGMSGAAMFCGDLFTGVIAAEQARGGHAHLVAVPVYVLFDDREWRRLLAAHDVPEFVLEPVELAPLAERPAARGQTPASLLVARNHVVSFRSRHDLMHRLASWSEGNRFSAMLLHGPGGQGKTRVAYELERRLADQRWATLWLAGGVSDQDLRVLGTVTVPLLIIVDYAETLTHQAAVALRECARLSSDTPIRMLLLARAVGDWWDTLRSANAQAEELLATSTVEHLPELEINSAGRIDAYVDATRDLALALTQLPGQQDRDWKQVTYDLRARAQDAGLPVSALTLHMTALADLLDAASPGRQPRAAGQSVEDRLISHERRYWIRAANESKALRNLSPETLLDVLAGAMLLMPDDRASADRLLQAMPALEGRDMRDSVRRLVALLYPPSDGRPWAGLQPDRLLERFVASRLATDPYLVDPLVATATPGEVEQALTIYSRAATTAELREALTALCVRRSDVLALATIHVATRVEVPAPFVLALRTIGHDAATDLDSLLQMARTLPRSSHCLADWAVELEQRIVAACRITAAARPQAASPELAGALDSLSSGLARLGRFDEAVESNKEACGIYRRLATERPDVHLPDLAAALNRRSERLAEVGRLDDALRVVQEAGQIYRGLAARQPDVYLSEFALFGNNLGRWLGTLGYLPEALTHTRQAVDTYRRLAAERPGTHLPDLAMALHHMSVRLAALDRLEDALAAAHEAVDIRQRLADDAPDAHLADLAASLNDLADRLAALGQVREALVPGEVAVGIFERLATDRPGAYLSDLARSLNSLAVRRARLGQPVPALTAAQLSVGTYRHVSRVLTAPQRSDFAMSLKNLADLHHVLGLPGAAEHATEALEMVRGLAARWPEAYLPALAACLNNFSVILHAHGRDVECLAAAEEAVRLRRILARLRPAVHQPGLGKSLTVLAVALTQCGRYEEGKAALLKARMVQQAISVRHHGRPEINMSGFAELTAKLESMRSWTLPRQRTAALDSQES
jgi:tetratricopeptide (TPR) repeat protein